jgi:hypothetical protein
MAVDTQPQPVSKGKAAVMGLVVLFGATIIVLVTLLVLRQGAQSVSTVAEGVSSVAENVSEKAEDVAGAVNITGGDVFDPETFFKVERQYVLRPEDLAFDYYIGKGGESPLSNKEMILTYGEARGKQYIQETGRVDGWQITMLKNHELDIAPSKFKSSIDLFQTAEGAQLAFSPEWFWVYTAENTPDEWLDASCNIGTDCIFFMYEDYNAVSGLTTLRYDVAFLYQNVIVWVSGSGIDYEINQADVLNAAQAVFDKLANY